MIELGGFALLRPLWLLALPALALALHFTRRRDGLGDWPRAVDAPLLAVLLRRQPQADARGGDAAWWSAALLALALSGPAMKSGDAVQFRNLDAVVVLLDASRDEMLPQAVSAAQAVLAGAAARQTGLALYAGDAYLASPLTDDIAAVGALLFAVDGRTIPESGARPDRALALARRVLRDSGSLAGDVVLIGDGAGVDVRARTLAAALAASGHAVHTLFVSAQGAAAPGAAERRDALARVASAGRGLASDAAQAGDIAEAIAARRVAHVEHSARRAIEWRDRGRWLLLLAAAPLLFLLRGRAS